MMQELAQRNYFTDHQILVDPYAYFEAIRALGPVYRLPGQDIVVVTGFAETIEVLGNTRDFSSAMAPQGPAAPLPFTPEGADITPLIEAHRTEFMGGDLVVSLDDQPHTFSRSILSRLFTPSKLRANEAFMTDYADRMVREMVGKGHCDLMREVATPYVTNVIADLLGVPDDDRKLFMEAIDAGVGAGSLDPDDLAQQNAPLVLMGMYFAQYVADRRANPTGDVLSDLAHATYPDGSLPDALEIVRLATFLFAAGQDTSAKLLGNALCFIADQPGLQARLRADPKLIPALIEEVLRLEGSTKMTARLARVDSSIAGVDCPAGTKVMVALAAANRDPRRWDDPEALVLDRPKIRENLAFGRGAHTCIGAPLARVEVRVLLEELLEHTSNIDLDPARHGPKGARKLEFEPSFIIRGLARLDVVLTPEEGFVAPKSATPEAVQPPKRGLFSRLTGRGKAPADATTGYATATTRIGALLANPETRSVIERHFPEVAADPRISMAKSMTFRLIQKFAPEVFTEAALDAVDAELARIAPAANT
ncbi:cytochrome P450 [Novosphingobium sp.]|uniref:cytochrome P450 n=1 Tax=Novosphingobium sp. TaxID=1874826 RepID=UPI0025ED1A87|nr:cytochrome P450 [Novosphingobium sp.]